MVRNQDVDKRIDTVGGTKRYSISVREDNLRAIAAMEDLKKDCRKHGRSFSFAVTEAVMYMRSRDT